MRFSLVFLVALALCCLFVNAVKVEVDVKVGGHHGHHAPASHAQAAAGSQVDEVDEALPIVGGAATTLSHPTIAQPLNTAVDADDDNVPDDGTAHMRKPKTHFNPDNELPIVGSPNEPVAPAEELISLEKPAVVAALRRGAATRGITGSNFDLHLLRIVNQFNVVNARLKLGRALEVLAYVLATAEHETGRYRWLAEIGGPRKRYAPYYGRGYVQLTWKQNYVRYNSALHSVGLLTASEDIVKNPNFLSQNTQRSRDCMAFIIIDGMIRGAFGSPVINYINAKKLDYINARRSVNILDKASLIAGYAKAWATILQRAKAAK